LLTLANIFSQESHIRTQTY